MWKDFIGKDFTREEFAAYVAGLKWTDWKPQGICLHNTAAPTLAQWAESGPNHQARIANLESYYENAIPGVKPAWHAGPAAFISRTRITVFSGFTAPGVHSRCFNATHIGIECVGDYNTEPWDIGDGALVRDNAVFALATLFKAIGVNPATLVFHVDCKIDNHDCPGHLVSKPDMIDRVIRAMFVQGPLAKAKAAQPAPPAAVGPLPGSLTTLDYQKRLAALGFDPGPLDGVPGPKTDAALRAFAISTLTKEGN